MGSASLFPAPSRSSALSQPQQTCRSRLALFAHNVASLAEPCKHVRLTFRAPIPSEHLRRSQPRGLLSRPTPPRPAPPRLRTGARRPLFTSQPRPPGLRAGEGPGREQASRAQLRARQEPSRSPSSRRSRRRSDPGRLLWARWAWVLWGREPQRHGCGRVCLSSAAGNSSLTSLPHPSCLRS